VTEWLHRLSWFGAPVLMTLLLHGLVFGALFWRWTEVRTVEARKAQPVAIKASLVSADSLRPRAKSTATPVPKPKPKPKPKREPRPEPKPKPVPKPTPTAIAEPEPAPTPTVSVEPAAPEQTETVGNAAAFGTEQLAAMTLQELESALAGEQPVEGDTAASATDAVAAIIQQAVISRWTRPPSARNGMQAILEIALVPTGDVAGVSVLQTSGNNAFDRSAISAVERAGRFPEVQQLEPAVFEREFRRFQLIFRPEDLRY